MKIFNRKLLTSEEQSLSNKARANKIERDRIRNQKREAKVERTRAQTRIREQNGGTILQVKLAKIIGGKSKSERKFKRVDRRLAKAQSKRARKQSRDERGRFVAEGRKTLRKTLGKTVGSKPAPAGAKITEIKTETVTVDGRKYKIPVDDKGYVPQYALAARFTNVSEGTGPNVEKRNVAIDQRTVSKTVLKGKLTPEDVKEWWARPNESDVKGVDDIESTFFDLNVLKSQGRKEAQGKIAVVGGTKKDQERIRKILGDSFTLKEQRAISKEGMTIEITDLPEGYAGQYYGRNDDITYLIKVDPRFLDDDTLLHEMVHHSRLVDKDRTSTLVKSMSKSNAKILVNPRDVSLEEAATVAETTVRQGDYIQPKDPHYYGPISKINKKDPYAMIVEDRVLFAGSAEEGSRGIRGKRALTAVEQNFDKSHISDLNLKDVRYDGKYIYPDVTAKKRLKEVSDK